MGQKDSAGFLDYNRKYHIIAVYFIYLAMRMYILNHTSHANPSQPVHQWQLPSIIFLFQCKGKVHKQLL